mgnify:CR=1 FL=1
MGAWGSEKPRYSCAKTRLVACSRVYKVVPHRGLKTVSCFDIWLATFHIIEMLYDTPFPDVPQNDLAVPKWERNAEIVARYQAGETGADIARAFGISEQRVHQIVQSMRQ